VGGVMSNKNDLKDFIDGKHCMANTIQKTAVNEDKLDSLLIQRERLLTLAEAYQDHARFYLGIASAIEEYLERFGIQVKEQSVENVKGR
jgi:hypothetical protein